MRVGPRFKSVALFLLLLLVPLGILHDAYTREGGILTLIYFGQHAAGTRLPEVRAIHPPATSPAGYDGQFYAQIALDPLLRGGDLTAALDLPTYRARRIGLPALAAVLGVGDTELTLHLYALANFAFWLALALLLFRFRPPRDWRDAAMIAAMLYTSGTLVSLARALTDLPAATLGVAALLARAGGPAPPWLLGLSALFKETSVLSFGAALVGGTGRPGLLSRHALATAATMSLPLMAWLAYVHLALPGGTGLGHGNFDLPLAAFAEKIRNATYGLNMAREGMWIAYWLLELLGPFSLAMQALYLFLKPKTADPAWAFGIGFAVLLVFLGDSVWAEQHAYCRVLLPLTLAFNLLVHASERGARFWGWFVAGNLGLTGMLAMSLARML